MRYKYRAIINKYYYDKYQPPCKDKQGEVIEKIRKSTYICNVITLSSFKETYYGLLIWHRE